MRRFFLKLLRRHRLEQELETELAFHREMASEQGNEIPLGNTTLLKEQARDLWQFTWFENLWRDLCYALRSLRHSPALVASALLSLGLGIGANTAIFSLAAEFLASPPSIKDPEKVISIRVGGGSHAHKDIVDAIRESGLFVDVAAENVESFLNWDDGTQTRRLFAVHATKNYFTALGIPVAHGRGILPDDPETVVVLSDEFWRRYFGGDTEIVGRALRLDGRAYTVVGILPAEHRTLIGFGYSPEVYIPHYREDIILAMYARLKPGMQVEQARAALMTLMPRLAERFPDRFRYSKDVEIAPMAGLGRFKFEKQMKGIGLFFLLVLAVVGLVLLIACINVAGLLLARGSARRQEFAIRLSIGAGRGRLLQQLLVESLLLALGGALCGLLLRQGLAGMVERVQLPLPVPIRLHLGLDWRILVYAALMTTLATLACGLLPAWQSVKWSITSDLRRESRMWLRRTLVVAQIALSVVVLATGFLFLRNLWQSNTISPGFDVRNTLRADVHLEPARYKATEHKRAYTLEALRTLGELPGIESVAAARIVPFTDATRNGTDMKFEDTGEQAQVRFYWNAVSGGYFRTMGIPLVAGRSFTAADRDPDVRAIVVNRTFVKRYMGTRDQVGRGFRMGEGKLRYVVVGVVEGTRNMTIGEDDQAQLYEPLDQIANDRTRLQFVMRSGIPPALQLDPVRQALRRLDAGAGLEVATLYSSIGLAFLPSQVGAALFGSLGLLGLLLAMVGLYGVMVYSVTRRTREIGVRMAIGAGRADIGRMVLKDATKLLGTGTVLGMGIALVVIKPLALFLVPGLKATDPVSFGLVLIVLVATGVVAAWGPARRATGVDPVTSLRWE